VLCQKFRKRLKITCAGVSPGSDGTD